MQANEAGEGGGIYVMNGVATIAGGSIRENSATHNGGNGGGGIYIHTGGSVNFSGGTIAGNTTTSAQGSANIFGAARFTNTSGQTIVGIN